MFEDFADQAQADARTGPLPNARSWFCPAAGCDYRGLHG